MSATGNRALIEAWVEAFNAFDLDGVNAKYAEDCEYVIAARGIHLRGRAAQRELMQGFLNALPDRQMTLRSLIVDETGAAAEVEYVGTSTGAPGFPPRGKRYMAAVCCVLRIDNGHITYERDYRDAQSEG